MNLPGPGHSSPVVWGNRIYMTCGDPGTARRTVLCLDTADGRTLWGREYPSKPHRMHRENGYATATPAADAGGVDAATGRVNWEVPGLFPDRSVGSPASGDEMVLASFGSGARGHRLAVVRPAAPPEGVMAKLAYDVTASVPLVPTPLVKDGRAFLWGDDGVVTCLRVSTGEVVWRERAGGKFFGSPVAVGDRLCSIGGKKS